MPKGRAYQWTDAMHLFCNERRHMLRRELAAEFNQAFNTKRSMDNIRSFCKRNGYYTGRTGFFAKGGEPHNKGKKVLLSPNCIATQFGKGNTPHNAHPLGTELKMSKRAGKDPGYWKVKTGEPNNWTFKHRLIWESENGPIPDGHAVVFKDSDENNFEQGNLVLLARGELAILNHCYSWKEVPIEQRDTVLLLARIQYVTGRLERGESLDTTENSLQALCDAHGMLYATVTQRIRVNGWSVEKALKTPLGTRPRSSMAAA